MSAVTGTDTARTIRRSASRARVRVRPPPSGTPRDHETPPLVVAIARPPAAWTAAADGGAQALCSTKGFGSSRSGFTPTSIVAWTGSGLAIFGHDRPDRRAGPFDVAGGEKIEERAAQHGQHESALGLGGGRGRVGLGVGQHLEPVV